MTHLNEAAQASAIMHVLLLDPSQAVSVPDTPESLRQLVAERLEHHPCFQSRLVRAPAGLGSSHLVLDPGFDIAEHVCVEALDPALTWQEFCDRLVAIRYERLDPLRPPWHVMLLTGVPEGHGTRPGTMALVVRTEHAAMDGAASAGFVRALLAVAPLALAGASPGKRARAAPTAAAISAINIAELPRRARRIVTSLGHARARSGRTGGPIDGLGGSGPRAATDPSGTGRHYFIVTTSLRAMNEARASIAGATVNDAVLSVIGGALRRYLREHATLPLESLRSIVTVSTAPSTDGRERLLGNDFAMVIFPLRTDIEDPLVRLAAIAKASGRIKTGLAEGPRLHGERAMQAIPPLFLPQALKLLGRLQRRRAKGPQAPMANAVLVNVPIGPGPLALGGAPIYRSFAVPFIEGLGVAHWVSTLGDDMTIGVLSLSGSITDPDSYREAFEQELATMRAAR
ncbi:wax ester/triacylglycerol synthase domain-containing protein [Lolliginicoccus levis]|uniref:wax ester/triacylglycerol synthase domain-containing protein n=1 Tax=Lolliginicoccus levis TaxID=2919542 RepID=UPI00241F03C2|nr:wax ester/triacylglycerol synthase domain-containing protein [Lolliginicoccus levis]